MFGPLVLASLLSVGLCAGGWSVVDTTTDNTDYEALLTSVSSGLEGAHCTTTKIETQVVAGLNIRYTKDCGNGKTCTFVVWQKSWENFLQLTSNECTGHKRQFLAGGYHPVDQSEYAQYEAILSGLESNGDLTVGQFTVTNIETQVVAGTNIRYTLNVHQKTCTIVVYDVPWEHKTTITSNDCPMHRRQLLGGYNTVDASNELVQKCLTMSLDKINAMSNSMYRVVEEQITKAQEQVVAGYNINVEFSTQESTCVNSADNYGKTANDCPVNSNAVMQSSDWKAHCFMNLQGHVSVSVNMNTVEEETLNESGKGKGKANGIKMMPGLMQSQYPSTGSVELEMPPGMQRLGAKLPHLSVLRRKRDLNFLLNALNKVADKKTLGDLADEGKKLLGGGDDHDLVNHVKDILGQDGHDLVNHYQNMVGGDTHDLVNHIGTLLGQDGHDMIKHGQQMLGGDDHDMVPHGQNMLGGDDHDLKPHGQNMIGGDDHDLKPHGQQILGGDDHDLKPHGQQILGGDDHDMKPHGQQMLGGDDHDIVPHGQQMLGGDDHDLKPHGQNMLGGDDHDLKPHGQQMLGGDDHDLKPHGQQILGGDDHDYKNHGQNMIGGDDHDLKPHGQQILGGDDHDYKNHGQNMIGGDDHDLKPHGQQILGGDDHDYKNHGQNMIGGDDHDLKYHGKTLLGGDGHDNCHYGMFKDFKSQFNKLYGTAKEEEKRFMIFCDNMRMARKLQQTEKGSAVYGATKFADLTKEEFKQYVGKPWDLSGNDGMKKASIPQGQAPESFDWRDHNAVTPVKNQGSCGSCWAFSTTGNIEGQWAIKKKNLVSLSEQELVDCDKLDEGCNGGLPSNAYKEIERLGGLETETDYSYKGEDEKCIFNKKDVKVFINDSVSISSDEDEMASWLAKNGPISIGINAMAMQFYMGGISHPWKIFCNPKNLDHGVLIVGYGVQDSKPYWIVKNSWGPDWGEKGYYLVYRGAGVCGLNTMCTSAVVD